MTIRCLDINDLRSIYDTRIKKDFSGTARRPFGQIKAMHNKNRYLCLALEEENRILAYATFIHDDTIDSVLLDYYAVDKGQRGNGIGSRFIPLIKEYWKDKSGIVMECEAPDAAKSEDDRITRTRRIDFYIRSGAESTDVRWRMFGMAYSILWLPVKQKASQVDVAGDFEKLYSLAMPAAIRKLFTRIRLGDGERQ